MKMVIIAILFMFSAVSYSQRNIEYIRDYFRSTNLFIDEQLKDGKPCFYEIIINENIPGAGPSKQNIKIYYSDVLNEYGTQKQEVVKISKSGNVAAAVTITDYLIEKGEVIFAYYCFKPAQEEQRFYYEKKKLIRSILQSGESKPVEKNKDFSLFESHKSSALQKEAEAYIKTFKLLQEQN